MKKTYLYLVIGLGVVLLAGVGYFLYTKSKSIATPAGKDVVDFGKAKKGEVGYEEPNTKVTIGSKEVEKGTFEKVEAGKITFVNSGNTIELPLTIDEVIISCTDQELASATQLDYNQVVKVIPTTPDKIGDLIPPSEPIVVFSADVAGVLRAHTVAMASSACPN